MKCQKCEAPATVHTIVTNADGKTRVFHLCRQCMENKNVLEWEDTLPTQEPQPVESANAPNQLTGNISGLTCPDCGTKYTDFRKLGRLGCPYEYVAFRAGLIPLLVRVHRAAKHVGKQPQSNTDVIETRGEIRSLRYELRLALEAEEYELAARLRDVIRSKGAQS